MAAQPTPLKNKSEEEQAIAEEQARYMLAIQTLPAPFRFAHIVWNILLDKAEIENIAIPLISDTIEMPVYRGKLAEIYEASGASKAYYSQIRRILVEAGSIYILERGNVHYQSTVAVDPTKRPPLDPTELARGNVKSNENGPNPLTTDSEAFKLLSRRVEVLEKRLGEVNIAEVLRNFESRLASLESKSAKK